MAHLSICAIALVVAATQGILLSAILRIQFVAGASVVNHRIFASEGQFPHHVAIVMDDSSRCGGALIKDQWVLTVVQCVDNAVKWTVYAGVTNRVSASDEGRQILSTRRAYPSPNYAFPDNDLALLKTPTKFLISAHVKPIPLPSTLGSIQIGSNATMVGYEVPGSKSETENNLWFMDDLKIVDRAECNTAFGRTFRYNHICVAGADDLVIGESDLGSPLLSQNENGELTPIGLASIVRVPAPVSAASPGQSVGSHFVFFSVADEVAWLKWATDPGNWNVYDDE